MKIRQKHVAFVCLGVGLLVFGLLQYTVPALDPRVRLQQVLEGGDLDEVVQFLGDRQSAVRDRAFLTLTKKGAAAVPALIRGTKNESAPIRRMSAWTLGSMGADAKVALPDLESCMMSDTDSAVRGWCAQAMGKIGSGDPEMIAKFASLLKSPDAQMRVHGVTALAEMPRESVRPFLESVLDDENETVRVQAEKALGLID